MQENDELPLHTLANNESWIYNCYSYENISKINYIISYTHHAHAWSFFYDFQSSLNLEYL